MSQPTPWQLATASRRAAPHSAEPPAHPAEPVPQAINTHQQAPDSPPAAVGAAPQTTVALRRLQRGPRIPSIGRSWPYALAAVGSVALFAILFRPWVFATSTNGSATVDAFGAITMTNTHLRLWSQTPAPGVTISGVWGLLTAVAILATVCTAIVAIRNGSARAEAATALAAAAVAVFTVADVFYLQSKIGELRASLGAVYDMGTQLGLVVNALRGGSYPWPGKSSLWTPSHLTSWAFAAPAIAFVSASAVSASAFRAGMPRRIVAAVVRRA